MAREKIQKSIDLNQFPHDSKGRISWKNSIGVIAEFFYDNERHTMEILDAYESNGSGKLTIKIDDDIVIDSYPNLVKHLQFKKIFYKPSYLYNVGDVVNNLLILERFYRKINTKKHVKAYKCRCLKDGYEFVMNESNLNENHGCSVCANKVVSVGTNDLATTHPDVTCLLVDKEEACKYTYGSGKKVLVKCPVCGTMKEVMISELVRNGIRCRKCSDGISYPDKFAYELFNQLSSQYINYEPEYSPDWANRMRYDNYVMLKDGHEIVVEMDGGFHYPEHHKNKHSFNNRLQIDAKKDALASLHDIIVIRVDCNYDGVANRFDYIKNNVESALSEYFDLSDIDWNACGVAAASNKILDVSKYYMEHKYASLQDIADYFHTHESVIREYLQIGDKLGLCELKPHDPNRIKRTYAVALYNSDNNLVGVFKSMLQTYHALKDMGFKYQSMAKCSRKNKPYKNYIFKRIPSEKYEEYYSKINKAI